MLRNFLVIAGLLSEELPIEEQPVTLQPYYAKLMNRCAEQLGLTPSARSRIIAGTSGGPTDDMDDLLGGR